MSRYIDADALIESIKNTADLGGWIGEALYQIKQVAIKYIDSAPTIEPKRGEWICHEGKWIDFDYYPTKYECSQCHHYVDVASDKNFCPNCGAKMGEREGE